MALAWQPRWPFATREIAVAHEDVYCARHYQSGRGRKITIVTDQDWQLEDWLEREGAARLRRNPSDREAIRSIYLWKTGANIRTSGQTTTVPEELYSERFAATLQLVLQATSDEELIVAITAMTSFPYVRVRVASAFAYWLRPNDFQLIDVRSTQALSLAFSDEDYSSTNYARFCALARALSAEHALSLRAIDRALFAYHKLLDAGVLLD